jgi:Helitron helicase-like domain at N-terminus
MEKGADRRHENLPTTDELALLIPEEEDKPGGPDLIFEHRLAWGSTEKRPRLERIHFTHPAYMPLPYVLLFPDGDVGRHFGLRLQMSAQMYYRYLLYRRPPERDPDIIHFAGRLFQQFMVDAYSVVELERLEFRQREQLKLRYDLCSGIQDYLAQDAVDPALIGRMTILPSSFTGGDHAMQQFYQDSMALVKHFGKPDLFITFTANPEWGEDPGEGASGHTDELEQPGVGAGVPRQMRGDRGDTPASVGCEGGSAGEGVLVTLTRKPA